MNQSINMSIDTSRNLLNNSASKYKFSFPKSQRFSNNKKNYICDSLYEIPSTKSSRTTSFGYGNKTLGIRYTKNMPQPATYTISSEFQSSRNKRAASFGEGRQNLQIGGPLRQVIFKKYVPGPGQYNSNYSTLIVPPISLKSRVADHSLDHLKKLPGPGAYNHQEIGTQNYYVSSRHSFGGNVKFSPSKKLQPIKKNQIIGPGSYDLKNASINAQGKYILSTYQNSRARVFSKLKRQQILNKNQLSTPGPGNYSSFSTFG